MKKDLRVKDLFKNQFTREISLANYLSDYRMSYAFKYLSVERVNSRHYRLFVKRWNSEFPSHACRISANDLVSDIINLALT